MYFPHPRKWRCRWFHWYIVFFVLKFIHVRSKHLQVFLESLRQSSEILGNCLTCRQVLENLQKSLESGGKFLENYQKCRHQYVYETIIKHYTLHVAWRYKFNVLLARTVSVYLLATVEYPLYKIMLKNTSNCLQICEEACEVVIYKTDNWRSIWIYLYWHFGHK